MDPHFHEYLGAVAGMNEVYGGPVDEGPSEFHGDLHGEEHLEHTEALASQGCGADCCGVAVA